MVDSSSGTVSESCDDPHDFPPCVAQYIIFPPRNVAGSITYGGWIAVCFNRKGKVF